MGKKAWLEKRKPECEEENNFKKKKKWHKVITTD